MECFICAILWGIIWNVCSILKTPLLLFIIILPPVASVFFRARRRGRTVAFFHPYCNAGGGGERVLWCAINAMHKEYGREQLRFVIFTGDREDPSVILQKAKSRFGVDVNCDRLEFVKLKSRALLEASNYPRFTLLLQVLAGFVVGLEAMCKLNPKVFIDTMGYPLTLPLFRWIGGCKVGCYVHYPTISCDMIRRVEMRESAFNNANWIARSWFLSFAKWFYYVLFARFYRLCGQSSQVIMVNGSWTRNHILELWGAPCRTYLVYPPCNVTDFLRIESKAEALLAEEKLVLILSVGQIRPEKDHLLQIDVLAKLKARLKEDGSPLKVKLVICGGCRNEEDSERAEKLKKYARKLDISDDDLEWALNAPMDKLLKLLQESLIGLHTMHNEHFGISVVEGVAAGQIMLANDSGGPKLDILNGDFFNDDRRIGFLASSLDEYVECALKILRMSSKERNEIRTAARNSLERFNEDNFEVKWNSAVAHLFS